VREENCIFENILRVTSMSEIRWNGMEDECDDEAMK
jgi:hypothetical protein